LLIGIAGTYETQRSLGTAVEFNHVGCYGIGAGTGLAHLTAKELGWSQWQEPNASVANDEMFALATTGTDGLHRGGQLLTCCSASASTDDVRHRILKFPQATAEDMEGYGVALACQLAGIPLHIARGFSNVAGDRNKEHWQIEAALQAVADVANSIMTRE